MGEGPCRHGTEKWCEECVTESWIFGQAVGAERGTKEVLEIVKNAAASAFLDGKDTEAKCYRDLTKTIEVMLKKSSEEVDRAREKQQPRRSRKS